MDILVSLILGCHLLAVNVATAGPLLAIALEWKERRGDAAAGRVGRALLWASVVGLLIGAGLGLLVGWWLWPAGLSDVVRRLPSKVHFGVWELFFSLLLVVVHGLWWRANTSAGSLVRVVRSLIAALASTNLMYHFPVLFAVMSELIHGNAAVGETISAAEFRRLLVGGAALARAVHASLASIAVAGLFVAVYVMFWLPETDEDRRRLSIWGSRWALIPTLAQIPVGLWVVTRVSPAAQRSLMGHDWLVASLFGAAVLGALWLSHLLATLALGEVSRAKLLQATAAMIAVVLLMTIVSQRIFRPMDAARVERPAESPVRWTATALCPVPLSLHRPIY